MSATRRFDDFLTVLADLRRELRETRVRLGRRIAGHAGDATNPHGVTAAQAGAAPDPHYHDARYVNTDGDTTMSGVHSSSGRYRVTAADGSWFDVYMIANRRAILRVFDADGLGNSWFDLDRSLTTPRWRLVGADARFEQDLTVIGTKNAQIPDPDDPAKAYRFAAIEADEPGMLAKRWRNVNVDASKQASLPIPEHLIRIGRDPMVMVSAAGPPASKTEPAVGYGWANWDPADPRVEIRAFAGIYHVLLVFVRADEGANGWTHVVDVPPDPEPDEPQPGL